MTSAVIQARTRRQLHQSIGYSLMGQKFFIGSATSNGTTATLLDTKVQGGEGEHAGKWMIFHTGTDDGTIAHVSAFAESTKQFTFAPVVNSDSTVSGAGYSLWDQAYPPAMINDFIDQAFIDATGRVFDPEEDTSIHLHADIWRYDIPSQFAMITSIEDRRQHSSTLLESCDTVWDTIDTDVTGSADAEIRRRGNASLKLIIAAGAAAGDDLATHTIDTVDISSYDTVEFWLRATTTTSAGDLSLILSDGTIRETLAFPAIATADTWQFARISLAARELDTALTTIAIDYTVDGGAYTLWVDDIRAIRTDSAEWHEIPRHQYAIETQARDILFKVQPSYRLLKIIGGDKPALLTADTSTTEIDDQYVINYVTSLAKAHTATTQGERQFWFVKAAQAKAGLPMLANVRKFSN